MFRVGEYLYEVGAQAALDSAADILVFSPVVPVDIVAFGVLVEVTLDQTQGLIATLDKRVTLLSDTGRVADASGIRLTPVEGTNVAVGQNLFAEIPALTSGEMGLELEPGESAVFEVTQAATAGDGRPWIAYRQQSRGGSARWRESAKLVGGTSLAINVQDVGVAV